MKLTNEQLIDNIKQWARDRGLDTGSTLGKQFVKLMEEFGELCSGLAKQKTDVIADSIGDMIVVMVVMNTIYDNLPLQLKSDSDDKLLIKETMQRLESKYKQDQINTLSEHYFNHYDRRVSFAVGALNALGDETSRIDVFGKDTNIDFMSEAMFSLFRELYNLATAFGLNVNDCLNQAWNEIKNRKGKMIGGAFVKEGDLKDGQ
ncbi:MazG-like family protein [Pasteurella canis]|uniref:MazG-like family protein n=1 Tax=Pasteurella canis TaxID=753 RepID=UPI001D12E301|nr:MazG-like family protein [Pasteurella canis]UDW84578.1 MazG-like family protein [Pasteurella canis]